MDLPDGPLLVSACLLGEPCRYDGGACPCPPLIDAVRDRLVVPVCPETLGGLRRPRPPAEIAGGDGEDVLAGRARVLDKDGRDVTDAFLAGAAKAVELARVCGATAAILKERSPSCGVRQIYDGTFLGRRRPGRGVAAAALAETGLPVWSEEDL